MKIKSTNDIAATSVTCAIYGVSGAGKTTLAKTLEGKTLIVSAESGLLSLKGTGIDFIEVSNIPELRQSLTEISKTDYVNVFFDSGTEISQMFVDYATDQFPEDRQSLKRWGYYNQMIIKFIKFTRDWNKNVFFTFLQKTDKDEIGRRFSIPDMPGSIASKLPAFMDLVFNLRVFEKEEENVRALLTAATEGYVCKDRSGKLDEYEKPHLGMIIKKVFKEN